MRNKVWKRDLKTIRNIGLCKYCDKMISSDEPFVIFATQEASHYKCMKKSDDDKQLGVDLNK